jgi:glycosyltransferase involved in cell wall biosynthesis
VAPSRWMAQAAQGSRLLGHHPCSVIPNGLDTEVFRPVNRAHARVALGLDPHRRYILFGAATGAQDRRKGFHLLLEALHALARLPQVVADTELLIFGAAPEEVLRTLPLRAHAMGYVHDEARLALLYGAADVFAAPSMQDNLPNTVAEALACGTPAVAFAIGGLPELVRHEATGWLAPAFDVDQFAEGLAYALRTPGLSDSCRADAVARFSYGSVAAQHAELYGRMVAQSGPDAVASMTATAPASGAGSAC